MVIFLSQVLSLKKKQADYTNEFYEDPLMDDQESYIKLPRGFDIRKEVYYVALLNYIIYGMVQFPNSGFYMTSMVIQAIGSLLM